MINKNTIEQARKQLGSHNDNDQPLEWCVQNMRLESERLKKNITEANEEIASMKKVIRKYKLSI